MKVVAPRFAVPLTLATMQNENGRSVLVVGASRGIGAAAARAFVHSGDRVAGTHRGGGIPVESVFAVKADVTDAASIDAAVTEVEAHQGPPEVVVFNAGITRDNILLRMDEDDLREVVETVQYGAFRVLKRVTRNMLKAKAGSVVLVSSISSRAGVKGQSNYTAAKSGLEGMARSVARELAPRGIRVNVVSPGPTDTDMVGQLTDEQRTALVGEIPLGRLGTADEIAEVIHWVAGSTFMTGAIVPVTGGAGMGS